MKNSDKILHNLSMNNYQDKSEIYDAWAQSYNSYVNSELYLGPKNLVSKVTPYLDKSDKSDKAKKIMDFGCGTGLVGIELKNQLDYSKTNFNLTGVDVSQGMILESRKLDLYDNLVCDNIVDKNISLQKVFEILGNDRTGFDLIISCGVFLEGHVSLESISRVLLHLLKKNGGILALTIRDSFLKKSPLFKADIDDLKHIGFQIREFYEIDYLKGVKAWLLIVSRNCS